MKTAQMHRFIRVVALGTIVGVCLAVSSVNGEHLAAGVVFAAPASPDEVLELINARAWHQQGYLGHGVRVGILDIGFARLDEDAMKAVKQQVVAERHWGTGTGTHGSQVAEVINRVAPEAELVLAELPKVDERALDEGPGPVLEAIEWLVEQDVDVINASLAWFNVGPYDGTSVVSEKIDWARDQGVVWVNAAGNHAKWPLWLAPDKGLHYEAEFEDSDDDGFHDFGKKFWFFPRNEVSGLLMGTSDDVEISLEWDDPWGAATSDYDLFLIDEKGRTVATSRRETFCNSCPAEYIEVRKENLGRPGVEYRLKIKANGPSSSHRLELFVDTMTLGLDLDVATLDSSIPCGADAAGAITAGAFNPDSKELLPYSSRGPTNDGRTKPDIVAPSEVHTVLSDKPFGGTSAAAPHVTGAVALLLSRSPNVSPDRVQRMLELSAQDAGEPGKDNLYGSGLLRLPAPPSQPPPPPPPECTENVDVALIIDSSGSMTDNDPSDLRKEAARNFVTAMQDDDQIAVVDFDSSAVVRFALAARTGDPAAVISAMNAIDSSGSTNIKDGVAKAYAQLSGSTEPNNAKAAVLLSDGEHNTGGTYTDADHQGFVDNGWPIYTVGLHVGGTAGEALLRDIAQDTGGQYFNLTDASQLIDAYDDIRNQVQCGETRLEDTLVIALGETLELQVDIPASQSSAAFVSNWGGSTVDMTLLDPNGRVITCDSTDPDVDCIKGLVSQLYRITNPAPGTWAIQLYGASDIPPEGEEVTVVVTTVAPPAPPDSTLPISQIVQPLRHFGRIPIDLPYEASDPAGPEGEEPSGVSHVELWYRYRGLPWATKSWSGWTQYAGDLTASPIPFTPAAGSGLYELYTVAVDNAGNREDPPAIADARYLCMVRGEWGWCIGWRLPSKQVSQDAATATLGKTRRGAAVSTGEPPTATAVPSATLTPPIAPTVTSTPTSIPTSPPGATATPTLASPPPPSPPPPPTSTATPATPTPGPVSRLARLSQALVTSSSPASYTVDFGRTFGAISLVEVTFSFAVDLLDPGDCLFLSIGGWFVGGFSNLGADSQEARTLTFPRALHPGVCNALLDGRESGELVVDAEGVPGCAGSVSIQSMQITVYP